MKQNLIVILLLLCQTMHAQFQNTSQAMAYFSEHINELDPIEGVYYVENNIDLYSAYSGWESVKQHFICAIFKGSDCYYVHSIEGDIKGLVGSIEKMGGSRYYSFEKIDGKGKMRKINFQLNDLFKFELRESNTNRSAKSTVITTFIKKHPTVSMYATLEQSKKEKELSRWTGTGIALHDGYVVTNYHVVDGARNIYVKGVNGNSTFEYNAIVVSSDKVNDLAIIKIKDSRFNGFGKIPYQVKTSISDVGEDIFVLGYPMTSTMGDEIKLTTGVISSKTGYQGDVSLYQISAPVQPGNSGGPLFDKQGNLIGIVSAKHKDAENVGYAIKASYLKNLVESAVSTSILPSTNSISNIPLTNQVKSLKNFVFLIKCSTSEAPIEHSNNTIISHDKTINNPNITTNCSWNTKVLSIRLSKDYTIVTLSDNNLTRDGGYYSWMTIDPQTYILANGQKYKLIKAEGIALSPSLTYFSHAGETKTFTLYFPPIPQTTSSIDLIESMTSEWRFYGIKLD